MANTYRAQTSLLDKFTTVVGLSVVYSLKRYQPTPKRKPSKNAAGFGLKRTMGAGDVCGLGVWRVRVHTWRTCQKKPTWTS